MSRVSEQQRYTYRNHNVPAKRTGIWWVKRCKWTKNILLGPEELAAVRIWGYFVGVGRLHFEFMIWMKLLITGFRDLVYRLVFYVKAHNLSESRLFQFQDEEVGGHLLTWGPQERNYGPVVRIAFSEGPHE
jgi:hypothetical protein